MKYDREVIQIAPMSYLFDLAKGYKVRTFNEIPEWRLIMMDGEI